MESPSAESYQRRYAAMQERALREQQLKRVLASVLDSEAYERLMRVRVANPERYEQLAALVLQLYQQGGIRGKLSEEQFKALVGRLAPARETRIRRVIRK